MKQYISDKDVQVVDNGVVANFKAGVARPLRDSLVDKARALGVKEVTSKPPTTKTTAAKANSGG